MITGAGEKPPEFSGITWLKKTRFSELLIRENSLDERGFQAWVFCPGMLFNSLGNWWGNPGLRDKPHQGLDVCLYRHQGGRILCLDENAKIPAMYDGVVVKIINDFLGKSVFIEHGPPEGPNGRFFTIYGHTIPDSAVHDGRIIKQGDIIATLADSGKSRAPILPHLHISIGWTPKAIPYENLDWEKMGAPDTLTLLDPLPVITGYGTPVEHYDDQTAREVASLMNKSSV